MANVRVAQTGQTAANRPIFEVMIDTRRFCFAVLANGRVQFKPRSWLFSLGICSVVCETYEDSIQSFDARTLGLDSNLTCDRVRFSAQTYGTGFGFIDAYSPFSGWKLPFPINAVNFTL